LSAPGTGSSAPFLSAVVCTTDRAEFLRAMLESLCRQTLALGDFEVVLVDAGSKDATREVAESFASRLPLRYALQLNAGVASARNHGISLARGEVVLFLDDADIADPALLEAHVETHGRFPGREFGVLGRTRLAPELDADPLMHFVCDVGCFLFAYPGLEEGNVLDFTYFWGGRSSCKRALLQEHGVFNPAFRFGCEDIELAFRLSKAGFRVVYQPRALSTMVRRLSFDEFCRRMELQGMSRFLFSRLHADEAVQRWTEVPGSAEIWQRLGPAYDLLRKSGRDLDRIARMRLEAGAGMNAADAALLYQGYWTAFRASRVKGIVERAAQEELAQPALPR
jgi:glycosyltransferase involved in cell wall biosynthesis